MSLKTLCAFAGLMVLAAAIGCSQSAENAAPTATTPASGGGNHAGWWCVEHGVPEGVCARCDAKLVADFKAKGDWCGEHDRPESQCFICHPEKEAEFAAEYEAKFGSTPPKPEA
jgi:hypothetical protein